MTNKINKRIGVLLTNTGTPTAPTIPAVRQYLQAFLSDKNVVKLPRFIWLPILYGLVLTLRPPKTAALYQKIWTEEGSPMRVIMQKLAARLQNHLADRGYNIAIELGMNYGAPSISQAIERLQTHYIVDEIIVLPLYPQYSTTTTASSLSKVEKVLHHCAFLNDPTKQVFTITDYANHNAYIDSLAASILRQWTKEGRSQHLLISFHGIPERYTAAGDPYQKHCETTAHLLANALNLPATGWTLCYQSRFGYDKWLKPALADVLIALPKQNITEVDVVCPGFPVDCLETLEEIAIRGKEMYLKQGGKKLRYLPALNDSDDHLAMFTSILNDYLL